MKRLQIENKRASRAYRQLWRIVDGAVADVFNTHPYYLRTVSRKRALHIRSSLVKRITGAVHGYAVEAAKGRSGEARRLTRSAVTQAQLPARPGFWARHLFPRRAP